MATILTLDPADTPANGETLVYDSATKKWRPGPGGSGGGGTADTTSETFTLTGTAYTTVGSHRLYVETECVVTSVRASVGTAPTGASLIVDVNRNGTTIYGTQANRPTITTGTNTDLGGTASNGTLAPGDYLTVDVDQVGSTAAGSNLAVTVRLTAV